MLLPLLRNFESTLDCVCTKDPALQKARDKMRAILEEYASTGGTSLGKLILSDLCFNEKKLRPELENFINTIYPLSDASRPSYISCTRRLVKAAFRAKLQSPEVEQPLQGDLEIPEEVKKLLPFIPRECCHDPLKRVNKPYTRNGLFFLLAVLSVWIEFKLTSLESLFENHVKALHQTIRRIAKKDYQSVQNLVPIMVRALKITKPELEYRSVPVEQLLEPLKTELLTFKIQAITFRHEKSPKERNKNDQLRIKAARYGHDLNTLKRITVEKDIKLICRMYGHILPIIKSQGLQSFGIKDLLRVTHEIFTDEDGDEYVKSFNQYLEIYKEIEIEKSTPFKRAGYDSSNFINSLYAIRMAARYNGYFALLKNFGDAYRDRLNPDRDMIDQRKEIKKTIYTIEYVDEQLLKLKERFDRIIKSRSFIRATGRKKNEADRDLKLCIFYVAFAMMRFLSYRQQCVRNCVYDQNIQFNRNGSITLYWAKNLVKNKKPIKVTLTEESYEGAWGPVIYALNTYHRKVYPYLRRLAREQGTLDRLNGQFMLYLTDSTKVVAWNPDDQIGAIQFHYWFHSWARKFMVLPDEAFDADTSFNPHFLRGLCMDWMLSIGMTEDEISVMTGDTRKVIRAKYFNKNAVQDATRIVAQTERRLREEQKKASTF